MKQFLYFAAGSVMVAGWVLIMLLLASIFISSVEF
jgi:hypothetical protein